MPMYLANGALGSIIETWNTIAKKVDLQIRLLSSDTLLCNILF